MRNLQINIPDGLNQFLSSFSTKNRNLFIIDAIRGKIKELEKQKLENLLIEGYKASSKKSKIINKDYKYIDLENWDEY